MMTCRYWEPVYKKSALCRKTDFIDRCKCGGDQSKCDLPEKKKKVVEEPKSGEWISVKDRLPEDNENVLAHTRYGEIRVFLSDEEGDWFDERGRFYSRNTSGAVTHWMPLPEPPKEEEIEGGYDG